MTDPRRPGLPGGLSCDDVRDLAASFVLGALTEAEMDAVREHLATCPEPHHEIAELGGVVPVLDAGIPRMEPPSALKDRIMAAAAADLEARRRSEAVHEAAPAPPPVHRGTPSAPGGAGRRADTDRTHPCAALVLGRGYRGGPRDRPARCAGT